MITPISGRFRNRRWSQVLSSLALTLGICLSASPGMAQEQVEPTQSPLPLIGSGLVESLNLSPSVSYRSDYVYLDGRPLFPVTAVTRDSNQNLSPLLMERIRSIHRNLLQIARSSNFAQEPPDIEVRIDPDTNSPVIYVEDQYLMTVTDMDAQAQGQDPQVWAWMISRQVRGALVDFHQERQTQFLIRQALIAAGILAGILIVSLLLRRWERRILSRQETLNVQLSQLQTDLPSDSETSSPRVSKISSPLDLNSTPQRQLVWLDMQHRLIQVGRVVIWGGGLLTITGLFPYTRWIYAFHSVFIRSRLLTLLGVGASTYVAIKLSNLGIHSLFSTIRRGKWLSALQQGSESSRMIKRLDTLEGVVKGTGAVLVTSVAGLIALGVMGVNIGPVLTSLGFIGLGISLAAQDLIKDLINGVMILLEDQFAEGDVVMIEGKGGLVEHINLRITQLRNTEGSLITVPNSTIRVVENLSNGWSRVDLMIQVAYETDIDRAMRVIESVAIHMSRDGQWMDRIIEPPQMLGVDDFGTHGITIRIWIKVKPLAQWEVAREYRRRLKIAFDQNDISIPYPQQDIWFRNALETQKRSLGPEESQALLQMVKEQSQQAQDQDMRV